MLGLGFVPLLHLTVVISSGIEAGGLDGIFIALALLYGLPPLATRVLLALCPVPPGSHRIGCKAFLVWWATAQFQMIFCRLPALEEILRLIPGLYSMWLRLWGSKVGRLTFWAPGLRILDRSFLRIGDDVVFGAGVRLNPHVIADVDGQKLLHLAPITLENRVQIGGYSLLTAGVKVEADESPRSFSLLPPFSLWSKGHRQKPIAPHTTP
jgi:hypothetical protein